MVNWRISSQCGNFADDLIGRIFTDNTFYPPILVFLFSDRFYFFFLKLVLNRTLHFLPNLVV